MRILVKSLIIFVVVLAIVIFALFNYRIISFKHGVSKQSQDKSILSSTEMLRKITSVKYYKKPVVSKSDKESGNIYRIYIETANEAYLLDVTENDINAFKVVSRLDPKVQPQKITPVPFYVDIIVALIVIVAPFIPNILQLVRKK